MQGPLKWLWLFGTLYAVHLHSQTTYVFYDQTCPMPDSPVGKPGASQGGIAVGHPGDSFFAAQSFTPWNNAIDFIDLKVYGSGSLYILLRSDSITGPVIASTDPIAIVSPPGPAEWTRFSFPSRITLMPDQTYYFQPVIINGNASVTAYFGTRYTAGTAFRGTTPFQGWDIFFREGWLLVVPDVPEPSSFALALVGLPALAWAMRKRQLPARSARSGAK